ncbi:MAG: death-on-curing protein [Candidatus Peribacteria bacterium]|jgi:death-on-curing protein|nr:death-on-curing protein [Candidatus Peribacteria bacterium]
MENFAVAIADNIIDRKLLKEIITSVIYEDSYSEELLLKIINSYEKTDSSIVHVEYKNIIESIDKN